MKFATRLLLGTFLVVCCTVIVLRWGAERAMRSTREHDLRVALERQARGIAELPAEPELAWQEIATRASRRSGHRIVVRDRQGTVLAASDSLPAAHLMRVEAVGGPGRIEVTASLDEIDQAVRVARQSMTRAALLALPVALLLAALAARTITGPLGQLAAAARAIAAGSPARFPRSGISEIDTLAQALRHTDRQLADRFDELRQQRSDGTAIVAAMSDGILAADARGRITLANPVARTLLGYTSDDPLPDLPTLFRSKAARDVVSMVHDQHAGGDTEVALDGRTVALHARPLDGGGSLVVLRDLTEVRHLEAVRRDFVANVSHELKTPLTSIAGYAETLAGDDVDGATRQRFIATIRANAARMQTLIDDLLDLSRIESGGWLPQPSSLDLAALVTEAVETGADRAAARGIRVNIELDPSTPTLRADREGLRLVLNNLLDNALRYADEGGTVTISSQHLQDGIELAVRDTGVGIPAEHLGRIFERFYRVDPSRSREAGGTGLGLAIVRHIVESHGGRVTAESAVRRGTVIRCWFPTTETPV